jgi:hypothetical protein
MKHAEMFILILCPEIYGIRFDPIITRKAEDSLNSVAGMGADVTKEEIRCWK